MDEEFTEEEMISQIKYLEAEGFVTVKFNKEYPGCYMNATVFWRNEKSIQNELEEIFKTYE
jgi:hypothetical protein